MPRKKRAYGDTTVAISKSREQIDRLLRAWEVTGVQWEDDYENGCAQLRFRWKKEGCKDEFVARFRVDFDSEESIREQSKDLRSGQFSEKKHKRLLADRGKREHRILLNLLKNMMEAIEEGIIPAEALLLPWLEDAAGMTVYEKIEPRLAQISQTTIQKALTEERES